LFLRIHSHPFTSNGGTAPKIRLNKKFGSSTQILGEADAEEDSESEYDGKVECDDDVELEEDAEMEGDGKVECDDDVELEEDVECEMEDDDVELEEDVEYEMEGELE
jgi:hypothetical protein